MGGVVVNLLGGHRTDNADVVSNGADVRKDFGDFLTGFPESFERELRRQAFQFLVLKLGDRLALGEGFGHGLAREFREFGFVVEGFEVRRAARHAEINDPFRFGNDVRRIRNAGPLIGRYTVRKGLRIKQRSQRKRADALGGLTQKFAAGVWIKLSHFRRPTFVELVRRRVQLLQVPASLLLLAELGHRPGSVP